MTEDDIVGWHHQLNGHEFEKTPGDSEGQGSLGSLRVRHNWVTEQQQQQWVKKTNIIYKKKKWGKIRSKERALLWRAWRSRKFCWKVGVLVCIKTFQEVPIKTWWPSRWVTEWLVDECGQRKVTLEPQWLHSLLTSSSVTWNSYISINHKASKYSPRSQEDWKKCSLHFCRNNCCKNSPEWASPRSRSRLWGWLLLFLFISLFLWELSWVSEAEQKHTNRMAGNDKNLNVLQEPA